MKKWNSVFFSVKDVHCQQVLTFVVAYEGLTFWQNSSTCCFFYGNNWISIFWIPLVLGIAVTMATSQLHHGIGFGLSLIKSWISIFNLRREDYLRPRPTISSVLNQLEERGNGYRGLLTHSLFNPSKRKTSLNWSPDRESPYVVLRSRNVDTRSSTPHRMTLWNWNWELQLAAKVETETDQEQQQGLNQPNDLAYQHLARWRYP